MRKHTRSTDAQAIEQWGRVCDESTKRYFAATRSISDAAVKSQCALLDAAGEMLVAGNRIVARNLARWTNGEDVRKSS
jgi:hypothetical protein